MKAPRQSPSLLPWILGLTLLALAVWALGEYIAARSETTVGALRASIAAGVAETPATVDG